MNAGRQQFYLGIYYGKVNASHYQYALSSDVVSIKGRTAKLIFVSRSLTKSDLNRITQ